MLSVKGVSYVSGGRALLREVDFVLEPGELLAIVGPNGAGKSTLLKTLVGDLTPSAGTINLDGVTLDSWTPLQQARRRAILPQSSNLTFPFRAFEVALMGRNPHDTGAAYDEQVSQAALEQSGVSHLAEREYPTLSGGEQQRVQVARVLSQIWDAPTSSNRYLLLDEPTNNLDLAHQHHCLHIAKGMSRQGAGVLAVLHDLNLAAQYADRVLILCQGQVVAAGSPEAVLTTDTLCRTFDTPVMVTRHPCFDCPLIVSAMGEAA